MSKKRREKMKAKASRHSASKPLNQSEAVSRAQSGSGSSTPPANKESSKLPALLKDAAPEWGTFYSGIRAAVREIG